MARKKSKAPESNGASHPTSKKKALEAISVREFVCRIGDSIQGEDPVRFAFLLGAGCSVSDEASCHIPLAGDLVRNDWLPRLHQIVDPSARQEEKDASQRAEDWAKSNLKSWDPTSPAAAYGEVVKRLFRYPADRQREIERICRDRQPGFGYGVLSGMMIQKGGLFNVVLTTNFDDMVEDALALYRFKRPLVIRHDSLATFIRPTRMGPIVVKLHGDLQMAPRNTADETGQLDPQMAAKVAAVLHDRALIVIGYGGADPSVLKLLRELPAEALHHGIYWVSGREPQGIMRDWLEARDATWVQHQGFDELMFEFLEELEIERPVTDGYVTIINRFDERYKSHAVKMSEPAIPPGATATAQPSSQAAAKAYRTTPAKSASNWMSLWIEANRLTKIDAQKADAIFKEAIALAPNAAGLLGDYALLLKNQLQDFDQAEVYFKRALDSDPKHASNLGNYANFLKVQRQDIDQAEQFYKRALAADPKHANNLGNYALLLENQRQDYDQAEQYYKRALDADAKHANNLGNYAVFLENHRQDYDQAEQYYKRALDADAKAANTLGNYALFLASQRQDYDQAEQYYKRALDADPNHANNLGNYAVFLLNQRQDYEQAEQYYNRALKTDPKDANSLANYCQLHLASGRREEGISLLEHALALNPALPSLQVELAFYKYAHGDLDQRSDALRRLRAVIDGGARSPGWNLKRNVERAKLDGHPAGGWLDKLAAVISDGVDPESLAEWPDWKAATAG